MNACSMYYSKLYDIDIDFQFVENTVLLSTILCELLSLLISHEHQKCDHTSVDWFDIHSATTEKWWWVNILNLFFVCLAFHFRSDLQWHYSNIRIRKAKTNMAIIWFFFSSFPLLILFLHSDCIYFDQQSCFTFHFDSNENKNTNTRHPLIACVLLGFSLPQAHRTTWREQSGNAYD